MPWGTHVNAPSPALPPPGWYADAHVADQARWWDGTAWTSDVRDIAPGPARGAAPAPSASPAAPAWVAIASAAPAPLVPEYPAQMYPAQTYPAPAPWERTEPYRGENGAPTPDPARNTPATIGLTAAIVSVFGVPISCLLGLVFAIIGLVRAQRSARAGLGAVGRSKAIWAVALSCVGVVVSIALSMSLLSTLAARSGIAESPRPNPAVCTQVAPADASAAAVAYLDAVNSATPAWQALDAKIAAAGMMMSTDDMRSQIDADATYLDGLRMITYPTEAQTKLGTDLVTAVMAYDEFVLAASNQPGYLAQHQSDDDAVNNVRARASARLRDALSLPPSVCSFNRP